MEENVVWENEWAEWMAMDEDGDWYEFLDKPECPCEMSHQDPNQWHSHSQHKYKEIKPTHKPYWEESLIERQRNIKTIQLYETSDNSVFRDLKEAEEHEKLLNLANFLYDEDFASISHEHKLIKKELLKNKDKLKEILFN